MARVADKVGAHVYRLQKVGKAGRGRLQGLKVDGSGHGEQGRVLRDQIEDRHEHEVFALDRRIGARRWAPTSLSEPCRGVQKAADGG